MDQNCEMNDCTYLTWNQNPFKNIFMQTFKPGSLCVSAIVKSYI